MAITLEAGVGLGANPIFQFGTDEQQRRWLPDLIAGRALGGFGLTEPDAGSDAGGTRTKAVLDEATDEWVINGEKAFITNSGTLDHVAHDDHRGHGIDGRPPRDLDDHRPGGFTRASRCSRPYRKMGWHASDTHGLTFTDCRVPAGNLLGERGRGFANFLAILDDGRVAIAAVALGVIECCLDREPALRQRTHRVRPPDRRQPGDRLQGRRPRRDGRCRPRARLPGRRAARRRPAVQEVRPRWPSSTRPRRRWPPPATRRRSSGATGSSTRPSSPASTATPRSSRSARARARSSGWSSPRALGLPLT